MATTLAVAICACLFAPNPTASITAEQWLGRLSLRHADQRAYVVLFFDTKHTQGLREQIKTLNKLSRRRDVLVVGITPEREKAARKFMKQYGVRFPVGVRSLSYKRFGVKRFPRVLLLKDDDVQTVTDYEIVGELLGPAPEEEVLPVDERPIEELKAEIEKDENTDLLEVLRLRMDPDEFMKYCDELEEAANAEGPWWGGAVRYQRHLANNDAPDKQPASTPGLEAVRDAIRAGTGKRSELRNLIAGKTTWSDDEVFEVYAAHAGDDPEDLVYRSDWIVTLGATHDPRFVAPLLDMLDVEPDDGIRSRIPNAIASIHTTHAIPDALRRETIRRLQDHLESEENVRWGIPSLELALDLLTRDPNGVPE